jgi:hypothetical protein
MKVLAMVEGLIWLFSLAFRRTPPVDCLGTHDNRAFGLPKLLVAIHASRQSCSKAGKA